MKLYAIESGGRIKLGKSVDPDARIRSLQTGSPFDLRVVCIASGGEGLSENVLHKCFAEERARGEWFDASEDDILTVMQSSPEKRQRLARLASYSQLKITAAWGMAGGNPYLWAINATEAEWLEFRRRLDSFRRRRAMPSVPSKLKPGVMDLNEELRTAIRESGRKQLDLANDADVPQSTISALLNGRGVSANAAGRLLSALGITLKHPRRRK